LAWTGDESSVKIADLITLNFTTAQNREHTYNYEQLVELQNVLMLIAPRRTKAENVDTQDLDITDDSDPNEITESHTLEYFIDLFTSITRLAEIYLKLLRDGCLFFDAFAVTVRSNITHRQLSPTEPILELSLLNGTAIVRDKQATSTLDSIGSLCSLMDHTFANWTSFVASMRDSFDSLNFFTLRQIKFLLVTFNNLLQSQGGSTEQTAEFEKVRAILSVINNGGDDDLTVAKLAAFCAQPVTVNTNTSVDPKFVYSKTTTTELENEFIKKWMDYLSYQHAVQPDAMTLKRLAIVLRSVEAAATTSSTWHSIKRAVPGYLHVGEPNLIVCAQREQIQTALSIYAFSPMEPMPKSDEILFCTVHTTAEEVENFLRVVFRYFSLKIFFFDTCDFMYLN
jgi:hypothetical protein